jgi:acyl carrier protein
MGTSVATNSNAASRIRDFVLQTFPLARKRNVAGSTDLLETGVIDSMGVLDLVGFLQQEFAITVEDDDLTPENFRSIDCMAEFLQRRLVSQHRSVASA